MAPQQDLESAVVEVKHRSAEATEWLESVDRAVQDPSFWEVHDDASIEFF